MRNNRQPDRRQDVLINDLIAAGRSLVVDNTNPSAGVRAPIISAARRHGASVVGYFFPTDTRDALRRNRSRTGVDRVPDVAIFTTRKRLELPSYSEGFDRLFLVTVHESSHSFLITPVLR